MNATDLVTHFFHALDGGAWTEAAALVDSDEAARFQRSQLSQFVSFLAYRDRLKNSQPQASGFGSNGEVSSDDLDRYSSRELPGFKGSPTLGALAALSPAEYLARHFGE